MTLKIGGFVSYDNYFTGTDDTQTKTAQTVEKVSKNPPKLPKVQSKVEFTALGCDTEKKLAQAGYMAAAAQAGIADFGARQEFAKQMMAGNGADLKHNDIPIKNDKEVKDGLLNHEIDFSMTDDRVKSLENFRRQYVENGGKIRFFNKTVIDLRQAKSADGATAAPVTPPTDKFHILLNNDGRPITAERILAQYAEDTYKNDSLWGDNYRKIGEMSADQGINPKIVKITSVGNKKLVDITLSPRDRSVINENYKIVQQQVNEINKIAAEIDRSNPLSQFILGALNGIKDNLVGTATMIAHPLETLNTIKEAVNALRQLSADDVAKISALLKDKITTTFTTKDGINSIPYGAGYVVGTVATDVVIGKGAGLALEGLKEIKPIAALLEKLSELKVLSKTKVAEMFSDEAASLASRRVKQALATTVYAGIPADVLADMAVVAGNKLKNGAVRFGEFSKQMVAEFGEKVKPKLLELYQDGFEKVFGSRKTLELDELLGGHSIEKHVGKSESWLRQRLIDEPFTDMASSFKNYETANRTIGKAIKENSARIEEWLNNTIETKIKLSVNMREDIGIVLERGKGRSIGLKTAKSTSEAEIILIKDNTPQGWHILTSYPSN